MPKAGADPTVAYAKSGGVNIAYQVFGDAPATIVLVPGFISHIEFAWHEPSLARFLRKLSSYARVVAFDKRGMGLSDRSVTDATPSLQQRRDDIEARTIAGGRVAVTLHRGPYDEIGPAYEAVQRWVEANGYGFAGPPRELYLTAPDEVPQEQAATEVQFPIR